MESALATASIFPPSHKPKLSHFLLSSSTLSKTLHKPSPRFSITANFSSNHGFKPSNGSNPENPFPRALKNAGRTLIFTLAATLMAAKFNQLPAKAETSPPTVQNVVVSEEKSSESDPESSVTQLMESKEEFVENLKVLLQKKLEVGEDEEALKLLGKLVEYQPSQIEWKFLLARLLSEMGKTQEARDVFEQILAENPLCFEALFENALLMDRCGEGNAVISRLERALRVAEEENKGKEARDVRLIMAQIQFLQKNIDDALLSYEELIKEDPNDFRPYFCKGMIYSLLDRNAEAREEFAKYKKLSPKKFEVEGFLRTSLSKMKLFGTDDEK